MGEVFTTDRETALIDLYNVDLDEVTVTEFAQSNPVRVNFFVQNRSGLVFDRKYLGDSDLTVDWHVTRDADGEVVASGRSVCTVPIYFGIEIGNLVSLNEVDGEVAVRKAGSYTVSIDLNADRAVSESYYLNNLTGEAHFVIQGEDEPEPEPEPTPTPRETRRSSP